ncbi:uncharacterized protein AMSG_01768 [Thecamonas trahens ATCC 50062]|uniref:Uncharacterized protein n=1 Tax=Thecamonas trahens ATCC 50062 TaxID=461836 RepID=A0A0L0DVE0_THETB|nr:hypothetical protein AMSG_01768 [Thecamonas trahens ATCC 50062]KNC55503.1 hypothetical protein AMSG_01768 [Thecamonas trahens ATCC 50062]|eukprot:XP_013761283.1 hypothetical protein AMSG_01768 [Thecamonas trahens ATCC 50062]
MADYRRGRRRQLDASASSVVMRNVMERQLMRDAARRIKKTSKGAAFSGFSLQGALDTYDPETSKIKLSFLRKRSRVAEIIAAGELIFALTRHGVCAAFNRDTMTRVCYLNITPAEVVRSLFYNKVNKSIITVSVYRTDNFSSLRCRTTPLEHIARGQPDAGFALFESESLRWPGFVEFDDVNAKVLTYSAASKTYKVWDLSNYTLLYEVQDTRIQEIKISPGIMLLIYPRTTSHVPLKILNIETGEVLKEFKHLLHRNKRVDFIEQFNEKLLIKQENENLQIVDVESSKILEVSQTEFVTPKAFIFLYDCHLFLTFLQSSIAVWNFRGELVTKFDDHRLQFLDTHTNNIYINSRQDTIISYCKQHGNAKGSINVSDIFTGASIGKIAPEDGLSPAAESDDRAGPAAQAAALDDVTALFYNEERNEIVTGDNSGRIHIWSN